jgi:hypothetical protein
MTAPDGTVGSFTLDARDVEGSTTGLPVTGNVEVTDNIPPVTREDPAGSYSIGADGSIEQIPSGTTGGSVNVVLDGTDADDYHDRVLAIEIVSLPTGGVTFAAGYAVGDIVPLPTVLPKADGTQSVPVTLNYPVGYYGTSTFSYKVVDLLGSDSEPQEVSLTVTPVPPEVCTAGCTIIVPQDSCVFNCAPGQTPNVPIDIPCTTQSGTMTFVPPTTGTIGAGTDTNDLAATVTVLGPCSYTITYQPPPGESSVCTDTFNAVTGMGCMPFTTVTITVCDTTTGLCTDSDIPIIVTPILYRDCQSGMRFDETSS